MNKTSAIILSVIIAVVVFGTLYINNEIEKDRIETEKYNEEYEERIKQRKIEQDKAIKIISEDTHIDLEEFLTIQNGMTYEEVKEIIGCDGTITSELGEKGTAYYTISYRWTGFEDYTSASLIFQNGKLASKMQIGLE